MSLLLNFISSADRAIFLKEKIRLYEQQKALGDLEGHERSLRTKQSKYEKAGEGLMKSAMSVMPKNGSYSGSSLADRARWAEKALFLRDISVNNSKEALQELALIEPLKNRAEYQMRVTANRVQAREHEIKVSYRGNLGIREESETQDIGETIMFYSAHSSSRGVTK